MKQTGLLNQPLSNVIAGMGHTDGLTIGDAGLPVPDGPQRIDLALRHGLPTFLDTLDAILQELCIERVALAEEMATDSPQLYQQVQQRLAAIERQKGLTIGVDSVPHETFKQLTRATKAVVRTGEFTPFANIILYSGVVFS